VNDKQWNDAVVRFSKAFWDGAEHDKGRSPVEPWLCRIIYALISSS
jgi:hypothetical protein